MMAFIRRTGGSSSRRLELVRRAADFERHPGSQAGESADPRLPSGPSRAVADPLPLLRGLITCFRLEGLYPNGHPQVDAAISNLEGLMLERLETSDAIRIDIVEGRAHADGIPFHQPSGAHQALLDEMTQLDLDSIRIRPGIERDEIRKLVRVLAERRAGVELAGPLQEELQRRGVVNATVGKLVELDTRWNQHRWGERPTGLLDDSYADALERAEHAFGGIAEGRMIDVTGVRELLQFLADDVMGSPAALGHALALKQFENYTYCHSVNVTLLTLMLGQRVGLGADSLSQLSEAALLHDVGKTRIPVSILRKPAPLNEKERELIEQHPRWGAETLLQVPGLSALSPTVALEHHVGHAGGGYPALGDGELPHLMSQLVAVCDVYEALTGARAYRAPAPPDEACLVLAEKAGGGLNPDLVRAFVNMVTFFPLGSVVRTNREEIGVVVETDSADPLHPVIVLVRSEDPRQEPGERIDTALRDADGQYQRNVVETLPPSEAHIDPGSVLVREVGPASGGGRRL
jgi:HD-GYP domain-containing protein (c-di-GMP phosphodiesterase class II)